MLRPSPSPRHHRPLHRMAGALRHLASPYQRYRHARGLHAVRVCLAMLITILITSGLHIPHGDWASVSMLIVIGGIQHHGNIRQRATERALGTMLGAGIGLLLIFVHELAGEAALTYSLLSLVAGVCGYYAIGRAGYVALLTAITMIIVAGHGDNSLETGLWRTLNVFIGIVVALVFSFALPLYASYSWRFGLARNLRDASALLRRLETGAPPSLDERAALCAQLNRRSITLRALIPSVSRELGISAAPLEAIQNGHRAILNTLELIAAAPLDPAQTRTHHCAVQAFPALTGELRAQMLGMARSLRAARLGETSAAAAREDGQAVPLTMPGYLQGAGWLMRQACGQLRQMRQQLAMLGALNGQQKRTWFAASRLGGAR